MYPPKRRFHILNGLTTATKLEASSLLTQVREEKNLSDLEHQRKICEILATHSFVQDTIS